jgi:fibronectin-binding autotransporter adhesin
MSFTSFKLVDGRIASTSDWVDRGRKRSRRAALWLAAGAVGLLVGSPFARAAATNSTATYTNAAGSSWITGSNWSSNPDYPSGANAAAIFTDILTANRAVTLDAAITLNSLSVDNSSGFTNSIGNGTGGSLVWDGTSPTFTVTGNATSSAVPLTVSATTTLNKMLTLDVGPTSSTSVAGTFNYTGSMSGSGGLIKNGDGTLSIGTGARTYTGETIVNAGRFRVSVAASPKNSSKVTVNNGGQIVFSTAGAITLGAGSVYLNGTGNGTFPAAIRADQPGMSITNPIVLQSDASISVIHTANSLTLPGVISGPGRLEMGTMPGDRNDQGTLTLQAANTYTGGTLVTQGKMIVSGTAATLGTGNVTVDGVTAGGNGSTAGGILEIATGVTNAIDDAASVILTGGGPAAGTADGGSMALDAGVNEVVNGLVLGGTPQAFGTYGSTASAATFKNDDYFSGTGILTVAPVPEPTGAAVFALGALTVAGRRRRR